MISGVIHRSDYPVFERFVYLSILVIFNLLLMVSWMPRSTAIGGSDVGISVVLLALLAPLLLVAPRQPALDPPANTYRLIVTVSIAFLLFWGYLGVFDLDQPFRAGRLFLSLGQGLIVIYTVTLVLSPRAVWFSLGVCALMLCLSSLLSIVHYFGGEPLEMIYQQGDRSLGLFKNPNQFGMIVAMVVPFGIALLFQKAQWATALLLLTLSFVALLASASKTNLFIALIFVFLTLSYGLITARRFVVLTISLPLLAVLIVVAGLPVLEFFNPRGASIIQDKFLTGDLYKSSIHQRYELWSYSLDVMRSSPWFGEGTGQRIIIITQDHPHSHNVFLDLGRTVGIPGLTAGFALLLSACLLAVQTLRRVAALPPDVAKYMHGRALVIGSAFSVISYVLSNQMSDSLGPSTSVFFWLCLALLLKRNALLFSANFRVPEPHIGATKPSAIASPAATRSLIT